MTIEYLDVAEVCSENYTGQMRWLKGKLQQQKMKTIYNGPNAGQSFSWEDVPIVEDED